MTFKKTIFVALKLSWQVTVLTIWKLIHEEHT